MNIMQMSFSAGILILIIIAVRAAAIDKFPKTMFITLWSIALCRLLIPFFIPLKYGIFNPFRIFFSKTVLLKSEILSFYTGEIIYRSPGYPDAFIIPLHIEPFKIIWILGALIFALFFTAAFHKNLNEVRTALPINSNPIINKWLSEQRSKRTIRILISDKITTPLTYGIFTPKIILPKIMDYGNEQQMRYILTHELVHIKRLDTLWKFVMIVTVCIHWFNPMVWVLYVLMNRDLEISCDEKVIKLLGENAKAGYALSLINMVETRARFSPLYSSFSTNATEERIVSIMKYKKTSLVSLAISVILITGAASVFTESIENPVRRFYGIVRKDNGTAGFNINNSVSDINEFNNVTRKIFIIDNSAALLEKHDIDIAQKFTAEVIDHNYVLVKDTKGEMIASGSADSNGTAILTNNNGDEIGNAVVKGGVLNRLTISKIGVKNT